MLVITLHRETIFLALRKTNSIYCLQHERFYSALEMMLRGGAAACQNTDAPSVVARSPRFGRGTTSRSHLKAHLLPHQRNLTIYRSDAVTWRQQHRVDRSRSHGSLRYLTLRLNPASQLPLTTTTRAISMVGERRRLPPASLRPR